MKVCKRCNFPKPECAFQKTPDGKARRHTCTRCRNGKPPKPYPVELLDPAEAIDITVDVPTDNPPARLSAEAHPAGVSTPAEPQLTPLEQAYAEARKAKEKRDLRREHSSLVEENQRLKEQIGELVKMQKPPSLLIYRQSKDERADAVACAIASDWHVEEPVELDSVHGLNEYNLGVATNRSQLFFQNLLKLTLMMARDSKINTIFISALGDFISGWIHEELIASGLLSPGEAAKFWKDLFISGIEFLLRESTFKIVVDMIPGNHGRMTRQMHFADPTGTSLETFAYHSIAGRFHDNPRVEINVAHHAMIYRKFFENFTLRQIHGYEVKYGGGVGGVTIPLNKAIAQWDIAVKADLTFLGHFHQFFDGGRFLLNGSMIGYNSFAQAIKASFEEPRQAFCLIHARKGGQKSIVAPIWLDEQRKAS